MDADLGNRTALCIPPTQTTFPRDSQHDYLAENIHDSALVNHSEPISRNTDHPHASGKSHLPQMDHSPQSHRHSHMSAESNAGTPAQVTAHAHSSYHTSPALLSTCSLQASWPFKNAHEARLFHHYIINLAPWVCQLTAVEAASTLADSVYAVRCMRQAVPFWKRSPQAGSALSCARECNLCPFLAPPQSSGRLC